MGGRRSGLLLCVATVVVALSTLAQPWPAAAAGFSVTIQRTAHGVPRITASDFASAGYGYGYSFAHDNICVMADMYVTVDAERSRYFGPNGSWVLGGNGLSFNNLNSDFFFQQVIDSKRIEKFLTEAPPAGPRPEVKDLVRGYTAGYNRYLADTGVANLSDPACRGKAWVHPITEIEVYRRFYELALLASSGIAIDGIGGAQPPTPPVAPTGAGAATVDTARLGAALNDHLDGGTIGSNAVAVGVAGTQTGHGLLLGNPHFPWVGSERFYESEITVPGVMHVSGASLFGVPLVLIGHTEHMAWSHTVSTARRFTLYQLALVPGSPTTYLVDGTPQEMTSRTMTVQVLQSDGSLKPQSRTLYRTRWGAVTNNLAGIPVPWAPTTAFALADANEDNFRYLNHFLETDMTNSTAEMLQVLKRNQGIPWVNTIVSDDSGSALYADISVVPNMTDARVQQCNTPVGAALWKVARVAALDGSQSSCAWANDADAVQPGIFGPSHLPWLFRSDYVENSNDSYWLSNPQHPLEGYNLIIGDERTARTLRTRLGLTMIGQRLRGTDGMAGVGFTRQEMQDMVFNDRQYGGELARDAAVAMCRSFPGGFAPSSSGPTSVGTACDALAGWDLHENLTSKGDVLWREFWSRALGATPTPWKTPFDYRDPVNTPNTLDTANPQVQQAMGDAINELRNAGVPLDAPLQGYQFVARGSQLIPIHGGPGDPNGTFNAINVSWTGAGYNSVTHGSSFVQVVSFNGTACPDTMNILTYSQSTDPTSPWFADQTQMFSRKEWKVDEFCPSQVAADRSTQTTRLVDAGSGTAAAQAPRLPFSAPGPASPAAPLALVLLGAGTALARRARSRARRAVKPSS